MGNVLFMRKGETHSEPISFDPVFANNDWTTIIEACQKNKVPETWVVGDSKPMTINNVSYTIDIIGKNHDPYSDGSGTAPITFQMHDCYYKTYMQAGGTNAGGWVSITMRSARLPEILALMPSEVQTGIKEVNKLTSAGRESSTINTTADKLFLLSEIEVFGRSSSSFAGEGSQYAYYAAGNSKVKYCDGTATEWWLRSPFATNDSYYCSVGNSGTSSQSKSSNSCGVAFAFCF